MTLLTFLIAFAAVEIALILVVRRLRGNFQWLITEIDEFPVLDPAALDRFLGTSFDAELGWVRRPDTTGVEKGKAGNITFHVDADGARAAPQKDLPKIVAAFGDSYVFCRQVEDSETWEAQLSGMTGLGVMNFGVGNYGADQALLRYEKTELPETVRVVVLGFVPETICRIQSCWKHYLEFGNTFAFKPRFILSDGSLLLKENVMRCRDDFQNLRDKIADACAADRFYEGKFRSFQFRFPYLLSFFRHPLRNSRLIGALLLRGAIRSVGWHSSGIENLPFSIVMADNLREAQRLYKEPESTSLLRALLLRFKAEAERRGHAPLVLVMPQLFDLEVGGGRGKSYQPFFDNLSRQVPVLDLTDAMMKADRRRIYTEDRYGGHFSPEGNRIVAEKVRDFLTGLGVLQSTR